jgi:hypothetical protein
MSPGNGVPAASDRGEGARVRDDRPLRDIEDLIAKLEQLNRELSAPVPKMRTVRTAGAGGSATPGTPGTAAPGAPGTAAAGIEAGAPGPG